MKRFIGLFMKILIVFFFILTLVFAYLSIFHKELILSGLDYMKEIVKGLGLWAYLIIFIFGFIESFPLIGISIPGQMVLITIAGFLGFENIYFSMFFASLGAILGNYVGYLLGVKYGDSFFEKYGPWIGVGKTDIKYVKKGIDKHGWLFVILGKFHNMFRAFVPFIAGSGKMNNITFMLSNIFGSILRAVVMVLLGVFFVENAEAVLNNIGKIILGLLVIFGLYIYFFKRDELKKYMYEKNLEMEELFNKKK